MKGDTEMQNDAFEQDARLTLLEQFLMIPDCGACEDDEHDDCSHPNGSVQVAVDEWKPVCCCRDHPLIGLLSDSLTALSAMCCARNVYEWQQAKSAGTDLLEALSFVASPVVAAGVETDR